VPSSAWFTRDFNAIKQSPNHMKSRSLSSAWPVLLGAMVLLQPPSARAANAQILGWNNLGMHCMDSDYSVFSVLPPYNTIEANLIVNGVLVTNGAGYTVTYQAIADPSGSFNSTAMGKGNYYSFAHALYGAVLTNEAGLAGWAMPGPSNAPQTMLFEATNRPAPGVSTPVNWFRAEGIPIAPYDDNGRKNPYPLMRLIARNAANQPIATNDIVLPVSDEMDCRACHASGTQAAARPAGGWVWDGLPERDFRLNILRLHDERNFAAQGALYSAALAARGFNSAGLYRGVVADGKPVLCAACHASEALGAPSYGTIPPLTASVHSYHAHVLDPDLNITLDNSDHRAACYRCHPGSTTRCLRGAMGRAIAADGSMEMQCQSCHGSMSQIGSANRVGWFMEPTCQSCHSGTATRNSGQIRYTSAFTDTNGTVRVPADLTFATQPNTPAPGLSLYRFSAGHGGLQCEACHGSTHAEFPSTHANDNLRNLALQGHSGVLVECTACHTAMPNSPNAGPHGMHPLGQGWVNGSDGVTKHSDWIGTLPGGVTSCQPCHGIDYRGTVLSRAQADRTLTASFDAGSVTLRLFRGAEVGCFGCHNGPGNDNMNGSLTPAVANVSTNTSNNNPVAMLLPLTGAGAIARIISQPENGAVALSNNVILYAPNAGFVGSDTFTFAAYNGAKNSGLATGFVSVVQGPVGLGLAGLAPPSYPAQWPVAFTAIPAVTNSSAAPTFDWDFGDGTPHSTNQFATHAFQSPGMYVWTILASVPGASAVDAGITIVSEPILLRAGRNGNALNLSWPQTMADTLLEGSSALEPSANWRWITNSPVANGGLLNVNLDAAETQFFRVRRPW
jgi:PKD repeat protein